MASQEDTCDLPPVQPSSLPYFLQRLSHCHPSFKFSREGLLSRDPSSRETLNCNTLAQLAQFSRQSHPMVKLDFDGCRLSVEELRHFTKGNWDTLQVLNLANNRLREQAVAVLRQGNYPALQFLDLSSNSDLTAQAMSSVSNWHLPSLKKLHLNSCHLTPLLLAPLCHCRWQALTQLQLIHNHMGNGGLRVLTQCAWPQLKHLFLNQNSLTEDGLKTLVRGQWPELARLVLIGLLINRKGCQYLSTANWPKLQKVLVSARGKATLNEDDEPIPSLDLSYLSKWNSGGLQVVILHHHRQQEGAVPNQSIVSMLGQYRTSRIKSH